MQRPCSWEKPMKIPAGVHRATIKAKPEDPEAVSVEVLDDVIVAHAREGIEEREVWNIGRWLYRLPRLGLFGFWWFDQFQPFPGAPPFCTEALGTGSLDEAVLPAAPEHGCGQAIGHFGIDGHPFWCRQEAEWPFEVEGWIKAIVPECQGGNEPGGPLRNMAGNTLGLEHGQRAKPAGQAIGQAIKIGGTGFDAESAKLAGIEPIERTGGQPHHVDAEAGIIVFLLEPLCPMAKEIGNVPGIARRPSGIERESHDLVVDAIKEEVEGLGAEALGFETPREVLRQVTGGEQHIVELGDRFGELAFDEVLD